MTTLRWGSATDVGAVREINQDSLLVAEPLFAVADGMGGHQGGEVASATALEILEETFNGGATKAELLEAVRRANAKVWDKAQLDESLHGMGTTLTAVAKVTDEETDSDVLAVVNVGDSRAYLVRDNELEQLTLDHSFVEEMVRAGELSAEDAESHPKRNILTRALGVEPTVEVDLEVLVPQPGDRVLLCSDGLVRELTDDQVAAVCRRLKDPDEAARELVAQAKAHGGHDNITVVIVDVEGDPNDPVVIKSPAQPRKKATSKAGRAPRFQWLTLRVVIFMTVILALVAVGCGAVVWYARSSYYVGVQGQQLVIYRGRPQPVLWFNPTVAERTNVNTSQILPSQVPRVESGASQSSLSAAQQYVQNLTSEAAAAQLAAQAPAATTLPNAVTTNHDSSLVTRLKRVAVANPRNTELGLLIMAAVIVAGAYALVGLGRNSNLPANIGPFLGTTFLLLLVGHFALRRFAPDADGTLFPIAALLNGLGYVFIARLNPKLAGLQSTWTAVGIVAFVATLVLVPRVRDLARYRYTFALIGLVLLISPIFLGTAINGSRIWIKIGPLSFQPGEVAKIVLAIFFASYLVEKRELLSMATRRVGPFMMPDLKHFGPILVAWVVALLVLVKENDFGTSLLFFALFVTVLYVGTGRGIYLFLGAIMLAVGGFGAYHTSTHVQERVHVWINPWQDYNSSGYQSAQAEFAMSAGGVPGNGLGLGDPNKIPEASTDFIFAAIAEETGLLGATAFLVAFLLFVTVGFRIAMRATNPFEKLLATGLTAIIGLQTFIIVGGVIRVVPLTGITLPFVSYGGSSLVTNYVLLALLLRLSNDQVKQARELGSNAEDPELVA